MCARPPSGELRRRFKETPAGRPIKLIEESLNGQMASSEAIIKVQIFMIVSI